MILSCERCGEDLAENDTFCSECGAGVACTSHGPSPEEPMEEIAQIADKTTNRSDEDLHAQQLKPIFEPSTPLSGPVTTETNGATIEPEQSAVNLSPGLTEECNFHPITLKYNRHLVFFEEVSQIVLLEVQANVKELRNIKVYIESRDSNTHSNSISSLSSGRQRKIKLPYKAKEAGIVNVSIRVSFEEDGVFHFLEADDLSVQVLSKKEIPNAAQKLELNISNKIEGVGHEFGAGIVGVSSDLEKLQGQDPNKKINEHISKIMHLLEDESGLINLDLFETDWRPKTDKEMDVTVTAGQTTEEVLETPRPASSPLGNNEPKVKKDNVIGNDPPEKTPQTEPINVGEQGGGFLSKVIGFVIILVIIGVTVHFMTENKADVSRAVVIDSVEPPHKPSSGAVKNAIVTDMISSEIYTPSKSSVEQRVQELAPSLTKVEILNAVNSIRSELKKKEPAPDVKEIQREVIREMIIYKNYKPSTSEIEQKIEQKTTKLSEKQLVKLVVDIKTELEEKEPAPSMSEVVKTIVAEMASARNYWPADSDVKERVRIVSDKFTKEQIELITRKIKTELDTTDEGAAF